VFLGKFWAQISSKFPEKRRKNYEQKIARESRARESPVSRSPVAELIDVANGGDLIEIRSTGKLSLPPPRPPISDRLSSLSRTERRGGRSRSLGVGACGDGDASGHPAEECRRSGMLCQSPQPRNQIAPSRPPSVSLQQIAPYKFLRCMLRRLPARLMTITICRYLSLATSATAPDASRM